jgi:hypothetical protein
MPEVLTFGECMAVLYPPDPVVIDDAPLLKWDIGGAEANCAIIQSKTFTHPRARSFHNCEICLAQFANIPLC